MTDHQRPTIVACPTCATLNRIPAVKLGEGAKCGRCGQALFNGHPIDLTFASFDAYASRSDLPLLVDFWAGWCGPCRQMAPAFTAAAAQLEPRLRSGKIDTEHETRLAARFGVQSIPTLILLLKGRELARTSGVMPASAIVSWARRAAQPSAALK